jgi:uncharacterized protein DUF6504
VVDEWSEGGCTVKAFEQVFERRLGGGDLDPHSRRGSGPVRKAAQMRRYDDSVDVRRGQVPAGETGGTVQLVEGPEQFLWRGRLWKVSAVVAHWVEAGAWWESRGVHAVLGADDRPDGSDDPVGGRETDLSAEREVWRVEAARGIAAAGAGVEAGVGVFDLVFDWTDGSWRLARCLD